jgi:hypothetical protein
VLTPPALIAGTPDGSGFLTVNVAAKTALAIWSGQLADGTAYTGSSALWDTSLGSAELPIWSTLNSSQGVLSGQPVITPQSLPDLSPLLGTLSWRKQPQAAARAYATGFDMSLDVLGMRYIPHAAGSILLGLPAPTLASPYNAAISFIDGGIESEAHYGELAQVFKISAANLATFPPIATNPTLMKITAINKTLGTFAGSLTLKDVGLLPAPAPTSVLRTVRFSGVLLQGTNPAQAMGYFLLPALPSAVGETTANTSITSGSVAF